MKRILCILSAMLILTCGCSKAEETKKADFRKVNWGMTVEEVKATEEAEPTAEVESGLLYDDIAVANIINAELYYMFTDGKLTTAMYVSDKTIDGDEIKGYTYTDLKDSLAKVYGEPQETGQGIYSAASSWETDTTTILLYLKTDGTIMITYSDIKTKSTETLSTNGL